MKKTGKIIAVLIILLQASGIKAQEAVARLDSTQMLIGDQIGLHLEVSVPAGNKVMFPNVLDTVTNKIEVVEKSKVDTTYTADSVIVKQLLTVTSFDTGYLAIPPFKFGYGGNKIDDTLESEPLLLHVNPMKVDTTQPIKNIKGPMKAPVTFAEMLPWILGVLALLLLLFAIWYIRKKKKENKPVLQSKRKPRELPHVEALNALEDLKQKKLWQNGKIKQYYTELTHILRVYVERKFEVPAVESTSSEIITELNQFEIDRKVFDDLKECLETSDMVKFAKMEPLPDEYAKSFEAVKAFINHTKTYGQQAQEEPQTDKLKERHVE